MHPHQVAPPEVQAAPSLDIPAVKPAAPDTPPPDILPTNLPVSPMGEIITYSWVNNQGPTPPIEYNWTEISATGTIVAQGDDTFSPIELGFPFTFYGTTYTSAYVSSNGFISFGSGSTSYSNGTIPSTAAPNNAIYALWDDLFPRGGADGNVYAQKVAATTYVVEWYQVQRSGGSYETFEIILDGADNTITLQYHTVAGGSSATVGVENGTGSGATQYAYSTSDAIFNGLAVKFTPATTLAYTIGGVVRDYDTTPVPSARLDVAGPISVNGLSDENGAYSLTVIAGTYTLQAQKDGYFATLERTVTVPPDQAGVDLTFPARYTIQGTVRDFDGTPIARCPCLDQVQRSCQYQRLHRCDRRLRADRHGGHLSCGRLQVEPAESTRSGRHGAAGPDRKLHLFPTLHDQREGAGLGRLADRGCRISTDYDDPVHAYDYTDATGAYELIVTAGTYHVGIYKSGMPSLPDQVVTVPPNQTVNFTYPRRYTIRGTVRNYNGAPVQDAHVSTSWNDPMYASAQTDTSGAYTLTVTAGTFTIDASKTGFPDAEDRLVTVPPDATGVDFTFPQPYPISGDGARSGRPTRAGRDGLGRHQLGDHRSRRHVHHAGRAG